MSVTVPDVLRHAARFPDGAAPHEEAAVWAEVLSVAARELATRSRDAKVWPQESQARVVTAIDEVIRLATVAKAPVLAAQEASGTWRSTGVRRFEDFRATSTRSGKGAARREVSGARAVAELDGGLDALTDGTFTPAHAERLGSIADKLPPHHKAELLSGERAMRIKELARKHDATRFGGKVEDLAAALSAREIEAEHQDARRRRHLELTPTSDGMTRISGLVDAIAGHSVALALEAVNPRPAAEDDRTTGQRRADALVALAAVGLGEAKATGNSRSQVLITMTDETFIQARKYLAAGAREALAPDAATTLGPSPVVRCQDGPLLPISEIARTLCDSEIGRLVIGADSQPLDLGRSTRLFSPAQRRAVIARDGGCAWDGCAMPARYCEVHHLDWWDEDHGHTDVDRGVLVCSFHHHEVHRRELDLVRVGDPQLAVGEGDPPRDFPEGAPPGAAREGFSPGAAQVGDPLLAPVDSGPSGPGEYGTGLPVRGAAVSLPGSPEFQRRRYRAVPRSSTRAERAAAKQSRLLAGVRADSASRKARRRARVADGTAVDAGFEDTA